MPDQPHTLLAVFGLSDDAPGHGRAPALAAQLGPVVGRALQVPGLPNLGADVADHLRSVLRTAVPTILTTAWNKRSDFAKYADPAQYPPDKVSRVSLIPHKVKWKARPTVAVSVNHSPPKKLVFSCDVILDVQGAELKIQGGRFMGVRVGKTTVEGTLAYGEVELIRRKSREFVLPGELSFGEGIPIRRARSEGRGTSAEPVVIPSGARDLQVPLPGRTPDPSLRPG